MKTTCAKSAAAQVADPSNRPSSLATAAKYSEYKETSPAHPPAESAARLDLAAPAHAGWLIALFLTATDILLVLSSSHAALLISVSTNWKSTRDTTPTKDLYSERLSPAQ